MSEQMCLVCKKSKITNQKWGLCKGCYGFLYRKDLLGEHIYTKKISLPSMANRLKDKYGKSLLKDMALLYKNPAYTLTRVGLKHGVTREYIRQIFKKLYKVTYKYALSKKSKKYHEDIGCANDPRYIVVCHSSKSSFYKTAVVTNDVWKIANQNGWKIELSCSKKYGDIVINGYRVAIRLCKKPRKYTSKKYYYLFRINKNEFVDFFILHTGDTKRWFIIPSVVLNGSVNIYVRDDVGYYTNGKREDSKKWLCFENAWHFLEVPKSICL